MQEGHKIAHPSVAPTTAQPPGLPKTLNAMEDAVEAAAYAAKYRKYEREFLRRINHLYFSGKTANQGGLLFESTATIDDNVINESKEPALKKYLAASGLKVKEVQPSKPGTSGTDPKLPSSSKKVSRSTPEGNKKSTSRAK